MIEIIRAAADPRPSPPTGSARAFGLTQRQADAILAMRLARLTQLEGKKLLDELEDLKARIEELSPWSRTRRLDATRWARSWRTWRRASGTSGAR